MSATASARQASRSPGPRSKSSPRGYATLKKGTVPDGYRPPVNCSGTVSRFTGGLSRWKEREISLDSNSAGILSIAEGPSLVLFSARMSALVEVLWVFEEKGGQKLQFTVTDVNNVKELFQVASTSDLDKWLQALQSHNCLINKPIKMNTLQLIKEKRDSWVVLYPDGIRCFKHKTDSKPHRTVAISEGAVLERLDQESFCLSETGDDQTNSVSLLMPEDSRDFFDAVEEAVNLKRQQKFSDSILEAYVWICEKGGSSFKKRFCTLHPEGIKYFKKRFDDNAAGFIRLPPGSEVEALGDDVSSRKNVFWVAENGDEFGVQRFFISTKTPVERLTWLDALSEIFLSKDSQVQTNSLFEGYLFKRSTNGVWKKNFFVLMQDSLTYSPRRKDTVRKSIDLNQGVQLAALKPNPNDPSMNKPGLIALAENGDEGTRTFVLAAASAASRAEWLDVLIGLLSTKDPRVNLKSYKEGYMRMQDKGKGEWKKRYFILLERSLKYYRKRTDQDPAGEIKITAAAELVELGISIAENRFQFSVAETGDEQSPVFNFSCPSAEIRTQWMNAIQKISKMQDSRVDPNSILEGYLWIVKGDASEKRYFILTQTTLFFFKKRADSAEAGSFEIKGEAEICLLADEEHPFSFSIAKSGDAGEKPLVVFARDVETRYAWVSKLRLQVSLLAVKESVSSIREGYVYVLVGSSWRKRYFILEREPASLNFFAKRKDTKPIRKMLLDKDVVVMLLDKNSLYEASKDAPADVSVEIEEVGEEEEKDRKIASMEMMICKNGDPGAKRVHLKGANESEAMLVADIMEVCLRKEFPSTNEHILKSAYVVARHESGLLKASKWLPSFLVLTSERLTLYKSCEDELPVAIVALDDAKLSDGPAVHIIDHNLREMNLAPQSDEEKQDWIGAINRTMTSSKRVSATNRVVFGAALKASFVNSPYYQAPSVIAACVNFLKLESLSGCLFRHPGLQSLIRGFIQNFEAEFDLMLRDKDSVVSCLRLYLIMLPTPLISNVLTKKLADLIDNREYESSVEGTQHLINDMDFESRCSLSILLHYLDHEIKRPEEVDVTLEQVAQIWAPILMQSAHNQKSSAVLAFLLRVLKSIFPTGPPILCQRLPPNKLQELKAQPLTFEQLFQDQYGLDLFARFVKENYLDESLLFLTATRKYRDICTSAQYASSQRHATAQTIVNMYIKQGAEKQCNISASLSSRIQARFALGAKEVLNGNEFAEAETEVALLEATNSYPRFQKTEAYDNWVTYRYMVEQTTPRIATFRRSTLTARTESEPANDQVEHKAWNHVVHDASSGGRRGLPFKASNVMRSISSRNVFAPSPVKVAMNVSPPRPKLMD